MLGRLIGWTARNTYSGIDRALRCFGQIGNKAADKLLAGVVSRVFGPERGGVTRR